MKHQFFEPWLTGSIDQLKGLLCMLSGNVGGKCSSDVICCPFLAHVVSPNRGRPPRVHLALYLFITAFQRILSFCCLHFRHLCTYQARPLPSQTLFCLPATHSPSYPTYELACADIFLWVAFRFQHGGDERGSWPAEPSAQTNARRQGHSRY